MYSYPRSPDALEARGLFNFHTATRERVSGFFSDLAEKTFSFDAYPHAELVQELVCLTAAEFALTMQHAGGTPVLPIHDPIAVTDSHADLGLMKANCNPIFCLTSIVRERPLTLADIAAYGSDVVKLEAVGLSNHEPPQEIGDVARAVDELERAHREVPSDLAQAIGTSGILRVQGFLWAVKLSLPHVAVEQAISDAYEAFELSEPVGPAPVPVA